MSIPNPQCPITQSDIRDPVISIVDGQTYEKSAILEWLKLNKTSPVTRQAMTEKDLIPNRALLPQQAPIINITNRKISFSVTCVKNNYILIDASTSSGTTERLPKNIILIIDTSGSMNTTTGQGEGKPVSRNDLVLHSSAVIINMLNNNDRLGIISFSDSAKVVFEMDNMSEVNKAAAKTALYGLTPDGRTNIWAGIQCALQMTKTIQEKVHVLLLTDGESDLEPPRGSLRSFRDAKQENALFHFFGYGNLLDLTTLKNMAKHSGGWFAFVPDASIVGSTFVNFIAHVLSSAADSVVIDGEKYGSVLFNQQKCICLPNPLSQSTILSIDGVKYTPSPLESPLENVSNEICRQARSNFTILSLLKERKIELCLDTVRNNKEQYENFYSGFFETVDDPTGTAQLTKAFSQEFKDVWGNIYIETMINALKLQYCCNFKDSFLFQFGSGFMFSEIQNQAEKIFLETEMKISSDNFQQHLYNSGRGYMQQHPQVHPQVHPVQSTTTTISPVAFYNYSGGCFLGSSIVLLKDGRQKTIENLVKGDKVVTITADRKPYYAKVECLVAIEVQEDVTLIHLSRNCILTMYHPVLWQDEWKFPKDLSDEQEFFIEKFPKGTIIYNLLMERDHSIVLVDTVLCSTVGHSLEGHVIGHKYFGNQVRDDLQKCKGFEQGFVKIGKVERDQEGMVSKWME